MHLCSCSDCSSGWTLFLPFPLGFLSLFGSPTVSSHACFSIPSGSISSGSPCIAPITPSCDSVPNIVEPLPGPCDACTTPSASAPPHPDAIINSRARDTTLSRPPSALLHPFRPALSFSFPPNLSSACFSDAFFFDSPCSCSFAALIPRCLFFSLAMPFSSFRSWSASSPFLACSFSSSTSSSDSSSSCGWLPRLCGRASGTSLLLGSSLS